jgi:hypothetical protein
MASLDSPAAGSKPTKPIYLMTVTLRNTYVPAYQPKLQSVRVQKKTDTEYPTVILFQADPLAKTETDSPAIGSTYLLRLELEPGEYSILGLNSVGQSVFVNGNFFTPLQVRVVSSAPGVYYLGHVEATVRERKNDEFRASGSIPVQEQRLVGAFGGTFDVEITDRWEADGPAFFAKIPALNGVSIQKEIMSPFNRASAQRWWEKSAFTEVP